MIRAMLFLCGCLLCGTCVVCATALMVLDKPWWTWAIVLLLGLGFIPRLRMS